MLDKLFGWGKKQPDVVPVIPFGRYSDNNKGLEQIQRWTDADNLHKEKKYTESLLAFFEYLGDSEAGNVTVKREGENFSFDIHQGSKIVRGRCDAHYLQAEVALANMPQPSVAVMRRLLEQNFSLYYSRYALDNTRLCMRFDTERSSASPQKLYYALKELAIRADKQDDLLVKDFAMLQPLDTDHVQEIPTAEKEVKINYWYKWIQETLDYMATLDADKMSGGISYLLLCLALKLDFLICPEGTLQRELEKVTAVYFVKDEKPAIEKNAAMAALFAALCTKSREEIGASFFRSKSTFAIVAPQPHKPVADSIYNSNQNMVWYRDNGYPFIGQQISEYGISYAQYAYSLPRPLTELFLLLMQVNNADYFTALGFTVLYHPAQQRFETEKIADKINSITTAWQKKYPLLKVNTANLVFDNLLNFNHSFTAALEMLNFDNQ